MSRERPCSLHRPQLGDCVLQAQVGRMYTWQNTFVLPGDVIILGDADLFVVGGFL